MEIMFSFYKSIRLYDLEVSPESHLREDISAVSVVIIVLLIICGNVGTSHYRASSWAWLVLAAPLTSITGTGRIKLGEINSRGPEQEDIAVLSLLPSSCGLIHRFKSFQNTVNLWCNILKSITLITINTLLISLFSFFGQVNSLKQISDK